ncbi:hypothetical protein JKP88DRAFT_295659 [Tribonema minus]|uniref:Uncharacterized protein n=1 Tax=Tribonema minus TaxID=303371 RepID=A0A835ZIX0_9STRA|nr:hypothetical protein JKP88DRAFT_295659 [Tribonema minus]
MEQFLSGLCPCLSKLFDGWAADAQKRQDKAMMVAGTVCTKKSSRFGFGSRSDKVTVRLSAQSETVLQWQRAAADEEAGGGGEAAWTDIDLTDVKIVDKRGETGLALVSRRGDLLLEVDMDSGTGGGGGGSSGAAAAQRDAWHAALTDLTEDLRRNPQRAEASRSVAERVKEAALKQKHFAQRSIELQAAKRDAEARKARFMAEAGGLKYTAMAMANRS